MTWIPNIVVDQSLHATVVDLHPRSRSYAPAKDRKEVGKDTSAEVERKLLPNRFKKSYKSSFVLFIKVVYCLYICCLYVVCTVCTMCIEMKLRWKRNNANMNKNKKIKKSKRKKKKKFHTIGSRKYKKSHKKKKHKIRFAHISKKNKKQKKKIMEKEIERKEDENISMKIKASFFTLDNKKMRSVSVSNAIYNYSSDFHVRSRSNSFHAKHSTIVSFQPKSVSLSPSMSATLPISDNILCGIYEDIFDNSNDRLLSEIAIPPSAVAQTSFENRKLSQTFSADTGMDNKQSGHVIRFLNVNNRGNGSGNYSSTPVVSNKKKRKKVNKYKRSNSLGNILKKCRKLGKIGKEVKK